MFVQSREGSTHSTPVWPRTFDASAMWRVLDWILWHKIIQSMCALGLAGWCGNPKKSRVVTTRPYLHFSYYTAQYSCPGYAVVALCSWVLKFLGLRCIWCTTDGAECVVWGVVHRWQLCTGERRDLSSSFAWEESREVVLVARLWFPTGVYKTNCNCWRNFTCSYANYLCLFLFCHTWRRSAII